MNKRELLAKAIAMSHCAPLLVRMQNRTHRLPILAYHRVFDMDSENDFPFDPELVSCSRAEFEWQMRTILRWFTPITFKQLLAHRAGLATLPANPIIITFDDGHRDNYTHAFPVLRELNIPATIFLSTDYVGGNETFWFDRICQLLYRAPLSSMPIEFAGVSFSMSGVQSRREQAGKIQEMLKRVGNDNRLALLAELENKLGQFAPAQDSVLSGAMSWDDVRTMSAAGIEFGSHTQSHPVLLQLDDQSLARELTESKKTIEREIGLDAPVIAYPVGKAHAYDNRVVVAAQAAGYHLGVSYITGINALDNLDRFGIRRLPVERYMSRDYFIMNLCLPAAMVNRL